MFDIVVFGLENGICHVSFNIGRIRTADEPRGSAWVIGVINAPPGDYFVDDSKGNWSENCDIDTGCQLAIREGAWGGSRVREFKPVIDVYDDLNEDDDEDESFEYASEEEKEPLEYASDSEMFDGDQQDVEMMDVSDETDKDDAVYQNFIDELKEYHASEAPIIEDFAPLSRARDEAHQVTRSNGTTVCGALDQKDLEHIAGPHCRNTNGYHGNAISVEEMRNCYTFQGLIRKPKDWKPAPDDEDLELESKYFLSGICGHMPSTDDGYLPEPTPVRHGFREVMPFGWPEEEASAMPFHPTCFEIFKRVSRLRLGRIDINGLVAWHNFDSPYASATSWTEFPRHAAVRRGENQWWFHNPGDEFLAANPIYIPSLQRILRSAINEDPSFSPQNGAFPDHTPQGLERNRPSSAKPASDPFSRLPWELLSAILNHLPSPSIANLRLASRAFTQLPISLFHRLLREEMPYLFEAWSDDPISKWAKLHPLDFKAEQQGNVQVEQETHLYRAVIAAEMPELLHMWQDAEPTFRDLVPYQEPAAVAGAVSRLPARRTDWYVLYRGVVRHWGELKGLQNRERVWASCEEIVRRIGLYRGEGKITE